MYRRFIILVVIILAAMCGLVWLGYHSIQIWAKGLEGARLGEFAAVAEQIRQDVKGKLDDFLRREQNRPYTDYLYYYVPENVVANEQSTLGGPVLRSPLAGQMEYGFAYGNFQIEPDGTVITPNDNLEQRQTAADFKDDFYAKVQTNRENIKNNLLPLLSATTSGSFNIQSIKETKDSQSALLKEHKQAGLTKDEGLQRKGGKGAEFQGEREKSYPIESLQEQEQTAQVIEQQRSVYERNISSNTPLPQQIAPSQTEQASEQATVQYDRQSPNKKPAETVQIRIGPFVPMVVGGKNAEESIFGGQVFLLRHVQIEDKHFLQGFGLNEKKLIDEVKESAQRFMRKGMDFELTGAKKTAAAEDAVYTAILDFGFGEMVLHLKETDPTWMSKQIRQLRNWYLGIVTIVLLAVTLGLAGLWHNTRAQIKLAQKKDDFISAVSHELRTPLTSIRMYAEMLEKNWVKSKDKLAEYYGNMRQESERLSRLVESVLDFSRIQKKQKKYVFKVGDINKCIADVVEMMAPFAAQNGFSIKTEFGQLEQAAFDGDAVTQIAVNLLDNAIKYARDADDKTIIIRTKHDRQFILIEVEDRGPGVPHRQRKKIFEEFYRIGPEATRETTGTGLGLALVKKFAQAHNGFVEIIAAKPTGAIFRVGLSAHI